MSKTIIDQSLRLIGLLNWEMNAEEIKEKTEELLRKMKQNIDEIVALPEGSRNFKNTALKLEMESNRYNPDLASLYFPAYVSTDSEIRNASNLSSMKLSQFQIELRMNKDLYRAILGAEKELDALKGADKLLLERTLRDFRRMGMELSDPKQKELKDINQELSKIGIEFSQALNEVDDSQIFSIDELSGVPEDLLKSLSKTEDGNFKIGVTYPEADIVLGFCSNPETRLRYSKMFGNRAREENTPRLKRALELRDKAAKIMGYRSHAEFKLEVKMASDPMNVIEFLNELKSRLIPLGKAELQELLELKAEELGRENAIEILSSDFRYYTNMLKDKKYNVDKQEVKKYFPTLHVVDKMLEFYQKIFGLKFYEIDDAPRWHEDVRTFGIADKETSEFIGVFYLDLYPRLGKFSHAAAFPLIAGHRKEDGSYQNTVAAMVCNFPKDSKDQPSLLNHDEVETLYHEFGHIIHQTVTQAKYAKFSGSSVSGNFVEAPSQMLENWVWEEKILSGISKHYKTGKPLPKDLLDKMILAKNANIALRYLRQLFFAIYDMTIHNNWNEDLDIEKSWFLLQKEISLVPATEGTFPGASFGHLLGGYDAGYYGYLWSEVIAQDLYTRFQQEGVTSKNTGMDYRHLILEPGNEIPEMELVEKFLGRKYNQDAFLRSLGLSDK